MIYPRLPEQLDRRRKILSKDIEKARQLRKQGKGYAYIGRVFGISETSAKYWTNDAYRELAKASALARSTKKYHSASAEEKREKNQKTIDTLIRKRKIQPEYKEYSDETHYRYAKTQKASETRKKYWSTNTDRLNKLQKIQYQKHHEKRTQAKREYYKKNREKILEKMRKDYAEKKKN